MGIRLIVGSYDGEAWAGSAVMVDSSGGHAFGPVFDSETDAEDFIKWIAEREDDARDDPRQFLVSELTKLHVEWVATRARESAQKGER